MVQRNFIKRRIAIFGTIIVCIFFLLALLARAKCFGIIVFPLLPFLFSLPNLAPLILASTGLGAIIVYAFFGRDFTKRILKFIVWTLGAIILSAFIWSALYILPRILMFFVAFLIIVCLYWPGKKRGLFLGVLGPVLALELTLLLTINLIIL